MKTFIAILPYLTIIAALAAAFVSILRSADSRWERERAEITQGLDASPLKRAGRGGAR